MSQLNEDGKKPDTVLSAVLGQCERHGDKVALHWLNGECEVVERITYGELAGRTVRLAAGLLERAAGVARGKRAVLCYPPGLEFFEVFLACIRAGVVAVPVSPPGPRDSPENLLGILADCQATCVLTNDQLIEETRPSVMEELRQRGGVPWYSTTTILANEAHGSPQTGRATAMMMNTGETADRPAGNEIYCGSDGATDLDTPQPGDALTLLYSPGPTGSPIAVMATHADILHNLRIMETEMRADSSMVEVSFLPHYQTMGLVASYLQTICAGGTGYFMSHLAFEENPSLWIQALSKFEGTHSKVPRFGFEHLLCEGFPEDVNLSSVRLITNASEIARQETILQVQQLLKPHGLKASAIQVGFGFMGHTLYVCSSQQPPLVCLNSSICCGQPAAGITVKIVNSESRTEVAEEHVGEIWVQSHFHVLSAHENKAQTLHAMIRGDSERAYLRTGVLGSASAGNLFVCGRIADAIRLQGRSVFPANIEALVEAEMKTVLRMGHSVAFSYTCATPTHASAEGTAGVASPPHGELHLQSEGIGYVAELHAPDQHTLTQLKQLAEGISTLIIREFQVSVVTITFTKPGTLPYTWSTSGHRQRPLVKEQLMEGSIGEIYRWTPHDDKTMETNGAHTHPVYEVGLPTSAAMESTSPCLDMSKITSEQGDLDAATCKRKVSPEITKPKGKRSRSVSYVEQSAVQLHSEKGRRATSASPQFRVSASAPTRRRSEGSNTSNGNNIEWITGIIGKILGVKLQPDSNIWACGCTSVLAVQISQRLQRELGFAVQPHVLFTHQTPRTLLGKLKSSLLGTSSPEKATNGVQPSTTMAQVAELTTSYNDSNVAIVGMACSFASCKGTAELWEMMLRREVVMTSVQLPHSDKTIFGAFTDEMGRFDYKFFGISKWEASTIDPQQSILLHVAWDCLQNAGYGSDGSLGAIKGTDVGVFVGATSSDARVLGQSTKPLPPGTSFVGAITANRISYFFDFKGPSVTVDTACGASLSALQVACSSLKLGECSAALVGGVNAMVDPNGFLFLANMGMLSPDGKARVFDAGANGYLRGEGCGVVFLKRVVDAERDGDRILAVIKSVVTNHNGTSATPTSPNCLSQQSLLRQSLKSARLTPHHICYIEAHGSGTKLGDPIEVDAIVETFCQPHVAESKDSTRVRTRSRPIVVGSVKANIGHLEQGAGIAGLIKTVMVLERARAPGNACLEKLNPAFTLDPTKITIPKEGVSLEDFHPDCIEEDESEITHQRLLAAAVNSFGFGGTNVNAILQQYAALPHLGRTKLGIMLDCGNLGGESEASHLLMESIHNLCLKLQIFSECYSRCMETLNRIVMKVKNFNRASLLQSQVILSFCLLYGMAETVRAQCVEINLVGGTGMCAELAALVLDNVITLSDAFHLLLMHLCPASSNLAANVAVSSKLFRSATPFFSQLAGKMYQPHEIPKAYLTHLLPTKWAMDVPECVAAEKDKVISSALGGHKPLLWISLLAEEFAPVRDNGASVVIQVCRNQYLMQEIREKLLEVRQQSDEIALELCSNQPSKDVPMPKFYDRYPLRALMDGVKISQYTVPEYRDHDLGSEFYTTRMPTHRSADHQHFYRCSIDSGSSYDIDPGYITQTASGESLEPPTPVGSPQKLEPTPALANGRHQDSHRSPASTMETVKMKKKYEPPADALVSLKQLNLLLGKLINEEDEEDAEMIPGTVSRLKAKAKLDTHSPVYKEMKTEVLRELQEEIQEDLDDPDIPLDELASSGIFQLGLDSLSVMQISSFIMTSYEVSKSFSELANCGTLGGIADMVLQKCPKFSGKIPLQAEEKDRRYPSLTKEGYYTIPSLTRLNNLQVEQLTHVENFTVARKARGKIIFLGKTNVTGLNLDTLVEIDTLYAEVRSRFEQPTSNNLNRPALVLFENVHPQYMYDTAAGYAAMLGALRAACRNQEMGAEIMAYDGPSGKAVVKVDHFY